MRTAGAVVSIALSVSVVGARAAEKPPAGPPGTVTLPLADYDRLVERAASPPRPPAAAPVSAVLSRVSLALRVADGAVRGTMDLAGEAYRPGPVHLFDGRGLLDARQAGRPLAVRLEGNGPDAVITEPGPLALTLDWAGEVVTGPGRASFTVPVPPAGTARASVDLPGPELEVQVTGGVVVERSSAGGRTLLDVALEPGGAAQLSWTVRESAEVAAPREVRFLSDLKTLVTAAESDIRLTTLVDLTVVQGEPTQVDVALPAGFEVVAASGATLEDSAPIAGGLRLTLREPERRRHQILLNLERAVADGSFKTELPLPTLAAAQRETGEVALEGVGTLELDAQEAGSLRRMDVSETGGPLRALAREPLLAAFRYHRRPDEAPRLPVEVRRFPTAAVLAALAERASVTTLVTNEGRTLTEVSLTVRNQAQPFLRVGLPAGATLLSAEVAGEGVKPVTGADGTRVPLLRTGFRPSGPYAVSFVYLAPGAPFANKGEATFSLPRLDVPVSVLDWELFLPDRYKVKTTGGDMLTGMSAVPVYAYSGTVSGRSYGVPGGVVGGMVGGVSGGVASNDYSAVFASRSGDVVGVVVDQTGSVIPGATVTLSGIGPSRTETSDENGGFAFSGLVPGQYRIDAQLTGFSSVSYTLPFNGTPRSAMLTLRVSTVSEEITISASAPSVETRRGNERKADEPEPQQASANVSNLQRRVAGVLPVRLDVPRAGTSYRFFRPLVVDEETTVRFAYKRR
jgi:Carboxypeptidase regulatory-like domain